MKKNLRLLHQYRQKMAMTLASIITMLIALAIIVSSFMIFSSVSESEDKAIRTKMTRVANVNLIRELVIPENKPKIDVITEQTTVDSRVESGGVMLYDKMPGALSGWTLPVDKTTYHDGYKYLSTRSTGKVAEYTVTVRIPSKNIETWMLGVLFFTLIASIPIFLLVLFISYKIVDLLFHPARDIVANLEDFASNVNHEFKTSLAETISSLELAEITGKYEQSVKQAISSSRRINSILDSLGHLVHFVNSDYRREKTDLIGLIEKALPEFRTDMDKKSIILDRGYNPRTKIHRLIDHEPLLLCFRNIFKNAIRYSKDGGTVELSITDHFIRVKDYGVGIEKENISKIFGRYFREDHSVEGSGIGLSLVKKIAERYGWKVEIQSEKGEFTEVTLSF